MLLTDQNPTEPNTETNTESNKKPENRRKKAPFIIAVTAVCVAAACAIALFCTRDLRAYHSAQKLYQDKNYAEAGNEFKELDGYKDSKEWVLKSKYELAKQYYEDKEYQKAIDLFTELENYDDSTELLKKSSHGLDVQNDKTTPVITIPEGKNPYTCFTGDEINPADIGATATDDVSGDCEVRYDTSSVDTNKEGNYTIELSAKDEAGNTATEEVAVSVTPRGIGDAVQTNTPYGDVEVTLDRVHWAGSDWTDYEENTPDGVRIVLVNMTVKNIDYDDEYSDGIFFEENAGFSFTDDTGTSLTNCDFSYGDGLYDFTPTIRKGQTARVLVPLYAPEDTQTVTLHLLNNATIKANIE